MGIPRGCPSSGRKFVPGAGRFRETHARGKQLPWVLGAIMARTQRRIMARAGAQALEILPDGTLLLGGDFKFVNELETHGVAHIFTNGVVDTNFQARVAVNPPGAQGSSVTAVQPLPGGNILVAGSFASVEGEPRPGLAVLSSNGTLRSDIRLPSPGAVIDEMALLTNGLILARTRATTNGVEKSTELFTFSVPEALAPVVRILSPTNNAE